MTSTTVSDYQLGVSDYQPTRCVLEMTEDSQIAIIVQPGCAVNDVHDMLRILMRCDGHFDHLTFVDEEVARSIKLIVEREPVLTATSYLPAKLEPTDEPSQWQNVDIGDLAMVGYSFTPAELSSLLLSGRRLPNAKYLAYTAAQGFLVLNPSVHDLIW